MKVTKEQQEKTALSLPLRLMRKPLKKACRKAYLKKTLKDCTPRFQKRQSAQKKIIEQYYGAGVFFEDAINFVCPEAYEEALKETGVEAVSRPEIDVVEIESGKDFVFTATVTTKPEVELGDYNAISVKKVTYRTTQKEIEAEIKKVQEQNARIIPVEDRAVKEGDLTVIDFEGFTDGVAFDGGKGTDYSLEIGSGAFIPGFEDQLVGAEIGKEVEVNVTFPKDYHSEDLKRQKKQCLK
ncbi:MAG: trigger factor [Clostridiales bacterium]|nr:MAG: trigger factor [Clostridiales bacterium]